MYTQAPQIKPDAVGAIKCVGPKQKNNRGGAECISGEEKAQLFLYHCRASEGR